MLITSELTYLQTEVGMLMVSPPSQEWHCTFSSVNRDKGGVEEYWMISVNLKVQGGTL